MIERGSIAIKNIIQICKTAVRSLFYRKVRSLLSMLGVVCGVMAVVAMIAIGQGAKTTAIRDIEQLGTRNIYIRSIEMTDAQTTQSLEHLSYGLLDDDMNRLLSGCDLVTRVAGLKNIKAAVTDLPGKITLQVIACSPSYFHMLNLPLFAGRFIAPMDDEGRNLVCVLGSEAAERMGHLGTVGRHIRIENDLFKVVGILKPIEYNKAPSAISSRNHNAMIFLPLETTRGLFKTDPIQQRPDSALQGLTEIVAQVGHLDAVSSAAAEIKRILWVAHHGSQDVQVVVPLELLKQARRTHRTFSLVLGAIAGISLVVGGIGIMNIMLATVSERTREIGIRRSVGASRRDILTQFLSEAILLTLCGGAIGLVGGMMATGFIALMAGWPMVLPLWGLVLPLFMALLTGVFFGIYPAQKAAMVDPIVALRHQG